MLTYHGCTYQVLPLYGISVYMYVLIFLLIERTDEFQAIIGRGRARVRVRGVGTVVGLKG